MIERILGTLLGGFFAWLGYRLFLDVTTKQNSSGEFKLPSGIVIHLTRIGPGIFFALFGAAVVCYSFYSQVTIHRSESHAQIPGDRSHWASVAGDERQKTQDAPAGVLQEVVTKDFTGIAEQSETTQQQLRLRRNERRNYLKFLNDLNRHLDTLPDPAELKDYGNIIPQIKLAVLETVWDKDWGNFAAFENWVDDTGADETKAPGTGNKEPYEYFKTK